MNEMKIDNVTYKISENNCYNTPMAKSQIVIATSLRKNDFHLNRLQHKDYGMSKKWNTFSITRDGDIYQHYNDMYHTDFLGIKEADNKSISIVLENMGFLVETSDNIYVNWLDEVCDKENVVEKNWLGYDFWEKLYCDQIKNTILLCKELCEKHNIPKKCIVFNHYHKDTLKYKGIVLRSNYIEDCTDINPLFNIHEFNEMLNNDII